MLFTKLSQEFKTNLEYLQSTLQLAQKLNIQSFKFDAEVEIDDHELMITDSNIEVTFKITGDDHVIADYFARIEDVYDAVEQDQDNFGVSAVASIITNDNMETFAQFCDRLMDQVDRSEEQTWEVEYADAASIAEELEKVENMLKLF